MNIESVCNSLRARHLRVARTREKAHSGFGCLPQELVVIILSALDRPTALAARVVCTLWERCLSHTELVLRLVNTDRGSNVLKLLTLFPRTKLFVLHDKGTTWSAKEWQELYEKKEGSPMFDWSEVRSAEFLPVIETLAEAKTWQYVVDASSVWIRQLSSWKDDSVKDHVLKELHWKKGIALIYLKKFQESLPIWTALLRFEPEDPVVWRYCASVLEELDQKKEAIPYYTRALELVLARNECADSYYHERASVYTDCNLPELALEDIKQIKHPDIYDLDLRAHNLLFLNRCEEAVSLLEELLKTDPTNRYVLEKLVHAHFSLLNLNRAFETLEAAQKIYPSERSFYQIQGQLLYETNRFSEALAIFKDEAFPRLPDEMTLSSVALCYEKLGMHEEATQTFLKVLEYPQNPDSWPQLSARGGALLYLKRYTEAYEFLNRALAIRPNVAQTWCLRAKACLARGMIEEAWIDICKAVELRPASVQLELKAEIEKMRCSSS